MKTRCICDWIAIAPLTSAMNQYRRLAPFSTAALATFVVATCVAVWVAKSWAMSPMGGFYLAHTSETEADIIHRYWPHRLIEPEWVSPAPDILMNWGMKEAWTRFAVVLLVWSASAAPLVLQIVRRVRSRTPS